MTDHDALRPVLADVRATLPDVVADGAGWTLRIDHSGWATLSFSDGSLGHAIGSEPLVLLHWVTEVVQEWVIEEQWIRGSNWPPCPGHPTTHPLAAGVVGDRVCWSCPASGTIIAEVGSL